MKRSATDVLRRGLDSMLANWPLIALRLAATIVIVTVVILSVIAAVVPMLVSAGLSHFNPVDAQSAAEAIVGVFAEHWMVLLYFMILMFVVFGLVLAIHSFVEAGSTQILVDAERRAAPVTSPDRGVFAAFAMDRWMTGARHSWWPIFWIYNIVWSIGLLFILVPLLATIVGMLAIGDNTGGRIAVGCIGLAVSLLILIPIALVCGVVNEKAIAVCVARNLGAREATTTAWRELRADLGRHLVVGLIIFAISIGLAVAVSSMSMAVSVSTRNAPISGLAFAPIRMLASFAQSIASAAIATWFMAAFVSMTEER